MPKEKTESKNSRLIHLSKGLLFGVITVLLGMVVLAFAAAKLLLPPSSFALILIPILLLGGFTGGFSAAAMQKENGLICGLIVGGLLAAAELAAVLLVSGEAPAGNAVTKGIILIVSAMVGGILGVNKKVRKRR